MEAGVVSAEPSQPFPPWVDARVWVGGDTWTHSLLWGALRSGEVPCRNVSTNMFMHRESGRNPMGALQQATENNTCDSLFPQCWKWSIKKSIFTEITVSVFPRSKMCYILWQCADLELNCSTRTFIQLLNITTILRCFTQACKGDLLC